MFLKNLRIIGYRELSAQNSGLDAGIKCIIPAGLGEHCRLHFATRVEANAHRYFMLFRSGGNFPSVFDGLLNPVFILGDHGSGITGFFGGGIRGSFSTGLVAEILFQP